MEPAFYSASDKLHANALLLLRSCVRHHIKHTLSIPCFDFASTDEPAWVNHVRLFKPYTMVASDGSSIRNGNGFALESFALEYFQSFRTIVFIESFEATGGKLYCFSFENDGTKLFDVDALKQDRKKLMQAISLPAATLLEEAGELSTKSASQSALVSSVKSLLADAPASDTTLYLANTLLLQYAVARFLPLSQRRLSTAPSLGNSVLEEFMCLYLPYLRTAVNQQYSVEAQNNGNIAFVLDGRLFASVAALGMDSVSQLPSPVQELFAELQAHVPALAKVSCPDTLLEGVSANISEPCAAFTLVGTKPLMRFRDDLFVQLFADIETEDQEDWELDIPDGNLTYIDFGAVTPQVTQKPKNLNAVKAINAIKANKTGDARKDKRLMGRARRQDQAFMRYIQKYASSLTGAQGRSLNRISILPGSAKTTGGNAPSKVPEEPEAPAGKKDKKDKKEAKGKKEKAPKLSKADQIRMENAARKADKLENKSVSLWKDLRLELSRIKDLNRRLGRLTQILDQGKERDPGIELEMRLYRIQIMLFMWAQHCSDEDEKEKNIYWAVEIFNAVAEMYRRSDLNATVLDLLNKTLRALGLSEVVDKHKEASGKKELNFQFVVPELDDEDADLEVPYSSATFQLLHCGHHMERNMGSMPDHRVAFNPDEWQRNTLDALDRDESILVVAPTSAGKTFISFYSMEQVLRADDSGILVYIAPSKALVNQIAAEVYARFSKQYPHAGKSVWAVAMSEYTNNDPEGCQILITIPEVLQNMVLSPSLASTWTPRIKRIVFDEVHSLGLSENEDGAIWEQLLLYTPCPITALSATIGNPQELFQWLSGVQKAHGNTMRLIQHKHRYSDLRKFVWTPRANFNANEGLHDKTKHGAITAIHPVAAIAPGDREIPADLAFEPRDCVLLYNYMSRLKNGDFAISESLDPDRYFRKSKFIRKAEVVKYELELKQVLTSWLQNKKALSSDSPIQKLLVGLSRQVSDAISQGENVLEKSNMSYFTRASLCKILLPMLSDLYNQSLLPAICFNYDRVYCEELTKSLVTELSEREVVWREESEEWQQKMKAFKKWEAGKTQREKERQRREKENKNKANEEMAKNAEDASWIELFDPEEPSPEFSFAGIRSTYGKEEFDRDLNQLKDGEHAPEWAIEGLKRGIAVHHSGMTRRYRSLVEVLFRCGHLTVVIATGTLALGINMPCKTTLFIGDHFILNALNFRQASGRAGRRGFDLLGNVGFLGVTQEKINRLLKSQLPDVNANFKMTPTYILRLLHLYKGSKKEAFVKSTVEEILKAPRYICADDHDLKRIQTYVRFEVEYLRREGLLSRNGSPSALSVIVDSLQFCEPSNLIFGAALRRGLFHRICHNWAKRKEEVFDELMHVLAFMFVRRPIDPAQRCRATLTESEVTLKPLSEDAQTCLADQERILLSVLVSFANTFQSKYYASEDALPVSGESSVLPGECDFSLANSDARKTVRSKYTALSGLGNEFTTPASVVTNVRDDCFPQDVAIPYYDPSEPLNSFIYDFYRHGESELLHSENGIPVSDIWLLLNQFSRILGAIVASLNNLLVFGEETGFGAGSGAAAEKDNVRDLEVQPPDTPAAPLMESWEDDMMSALDDGDDASSGVGLDIAALEGTYDVMHALEALKQNFDAKFQLMWA